MFQFEILCLKHNKTTKNHYFFSIKFKLKLQEFIRKKLLNLNWKVNCKFYFFIYYLKSEHVYLPI